MRGLRSCVFPGIDMPGRRTETIDDDDEEIYEYLEEKLLSPTTLSELHLPLLGLSVVPNEKFITSKIPKEKLAIVQASVPCDADNGEEWETIETTVVYDNGDKESFLEPDFSLTRQPKSDLTFFEKCWEYIVNMSIRLCCPNSTSETSEISRKMSVVVNNVDHVSSRLFPATFLAINIIYWIMYVYVL
jgi:hypothetical protein